MKDKKSVISGLILGVFLFSILFLAFEYFWTNLHMDLAMYQTNSIIIAAGLCSLAVLLLIIMILIKKKNSVAKGMIFSILVSVGLVLVYSQILTPFSLKRARDRDKKALMKMIQQTFGGSPAEFNMQHKR